MNIEIKFSYGITGCVCMCFVCVYEYMGVYMRVFVCMCICVYVYMCACARAHVRVRIRLECVCVECVLCGLCLSKHDCKFLYLSSPTTCALAFSPHFLCHCVRGC